MKRHVKSLALLSFLLLFGCGGGATSTSESNLFSDSPQDKLESLANPAKASLFAAEDGNMDMIALIKEIRKTKPTASEAKAWANIANSSENSANQRRLALYQLLDRHARHTMTLRDLSMLLRQPSWLNENNVGKVGSISGYIPIDMVPDEEVFGIVQGLSEDDSSSFWIRVKGNPSAHDVFVALKGYVGVASNLKVTAVGIAVPIDEQALVSDPQKERLLNAAEKLNTPPK